MNLRFNVKDESEIHSIKDVISFDLVGHDDEEPITLLDMLMRSGIDEDIEAHITNNVVILSGNVNISKGLRLNSLLPITGCDLKENNMKFYIDFSGLANKASVKMIVVALGIYYDD